MKRGGLALVAAAIIVSFVALGSAALTERTVGAAGLQGATDKNPVPMSDTSIKAGALVYAKNCRACHGLRGEGDGITAPPDSKPANLAAGKLKHGDSDGAIFKSIKMGIGPKFDMKAWGGELSDQDIWATVNFIRDLQAKRAARTGAKPKTK
jgi:mono/diheme cytochrome c family protein